MKEEIDVPQVGALVILLAEALTITSVEITETAVIELLGDVALTKKETKDVAAWINYVDQCNV
jgi:hypothetical protein